MKYSAMFNLLFFLATGLAAAQEIKREALIEGAKKEGKLQIYALLAVSDHTQIIERFKAKYPFIDAALYRAKHTGKNRVVSAEE